MFKNLKQGITTSTDPNKITPRITFISYGMFFNKCIGEINFFRTKERIAKIVFTCKQTKDPNILTAFINLLCIKNSYRGKGLGKLVMTETINFFKNLALSSKKSIFFHLVSASIPDLPAWCGPCNLSLQDQQSIREKFYTNLGLKKSISGLSWSEWIEYLLCGEPVNFGCFFQTDPSKHLPAQYKKHSFNTISTTKMEKAFECSHPHIRTFFEQLTSYLLPLFTPSSTPIYPFISEKFSFNKKTECSSITSVSYGIHTYPFNCPRTYFPLIDASYTTKNKHWEIQDNTSHCKDIARLQTQFKSLLHNN